MVFVILPKPRPHIKQLVADGKFADALSIVKSFRIGFTRDEKRTLQIAHECFTGNCKFYNDLGVNTANEIQKAKELLVIHYFK